MFRLPAGSTLRVSRQGQSDVRQGPDYEAGHSARGPAVEAIFIIFAIVLGLAALDAAALTWGVDSREPYQDDRRR